MDAINLGWCVGLSGVDVGFAIKRQICWRSVISSGVDGMDADACIDDVDVRMDGVNVDADVDDCDGWTVCADDDDDDDDDDDGTADGDAVGDVDDVTVGWAVWVDPALQRFVVEWESNDNLMLDMGCLIFFSMICSLVAKSEG